MTDLIEVFDVSNDDSTRYILVIGEAPALVNIHGLVTQTNDSTEDVRTILLLTSDGVTAPVQVEGDNRGKYFVVLLGTETVVEEIQYARDCEGEPDYVTYREVFVNGFTTDEVPVFVAA